MYLKLIFAGFRLAHIRWKIRRIDAMRDEALEDLVWAIKMRKYAKNAFIDISQEADKLKEAQQQQLYAITKELV